ncbi:MAG: HNH endonuclease [Verrucomicrobiae bacterium]|nr:HNH endonuclease [Verrucomicrobiae bacterium]
MQRIAVFARNHAQYLVSACAVSDVDPSRLITFRSAVRWTRAKQALDEQKIAQVYLAPIGSRGIVEYEATLKAIVLNPDARDADVAKALDHALPETTGEGLWGKDGPEVKTLYTISHCRSLALPFPITLLQKASDGQPVSKDYGYSYVPVLELDGFASADSHPEEIAQPSLYFEGATRTIAINAYERNAAAREACVAHYGANCAVCGFNFGDTYGKIANGFIHVHHLIPLASVKKGYQINPIKDLRPVCPNCHAVLHMQTPPFAIQELTAIIKAKV